jgi:hypothetical protein
MLYVVNAAVVGAILSLGIIAGSAAPVQARESVSFNGGRQKDRHHVFDCRFRDRGERLFWFRRSSRWSNA